MGKGRTEGERGIIQKKGNGKIARAEDIIPGESSKELNKSWEIQNWFYCRETNIRKV